MSCSATRSSILLKGPVFPDPLAVNGNGSSIRRRHRPGLCSIDIVVSRLVDTSTARVAGCRGRAVTAVESRAVESWPPGNETRRPPRTVFLDDQSSTSLAAVVHESNPDSASPPQDHAEKEMPVFCDGPNELAAPFASSKIDNDRHR